MPILIQEKELIKKEKEQPLNVDTIGSEAWRYINLKLYVELN